MSDMGLPSQPFGLGGKLDLLNPEAEYLDPNPDIHALFLQYNQMFFNGALAGVELRWSKRMTLCAGLCVYEGRGGMCSIRLSQPLLQFRPRSDLINTLLHEMIHAYLFVTRNNRDHDAHGPEFHKHMHRINAAASTNITVYHNFHDEVEVHRKHWWRCDGPCRHQPPYYGFVKRAMNRAPSSRDFWWAEHQRKCGGTYTKVKEPEDYGKKKSKKKKEGAKKAGDGGQKTKLNEWLDGGSLQNLWGLDAPDPEPSSSKHSGVSPEFERVGIDPWNKSGGRRLGSGPKRKTVPIGEEEDAPNKRQAISPPSSFGGASEEKRDVVVDLTGSDEDDASEVNLVFSTPSSERRGNKRDSSTSEDLNDSDPFGKRRRIQNFPSPQRPRQSTGPSLEQWFSRVTSRIFSQCSGGVRVVHLRPSYFP